MVSEEWIYFNILDKPEAETFILNRMLQQLTNNGISLDNIVNDLHIGKAEAEALKQWQTHSKKPEPYVINHLLLRL